MKSALLVLLSLALLLGLVACVALADEDACEMIRTDAPAIVVNGTTLVPMRAIFEWLGAKVTYTSADKHIEALRKGISVNLWIGKSGYKIRSSDGSQKVGNLLAKPVVRNERTLVPLRFVSEAMKCKVVYDADAKTVQIKDGSRCGLVMLP
jgi:hypothetical protein